MNTQIQRVSQSFGQGNAGDVEDLAGAVLLNLYNEPFFDAPPVTKEDLEAAVAALEAAVSAQAQGGTAATAEKENCRRALVKLLKQLAFYVQVKSDNDLARLLSSGFQAVRSSTTREELAAPSTVRVISGISGESLLTVPPVRLSRCYEVAIALVDEQGVAAPWSPGGIFTSSRKMRITGLIPGSLYIYRVRAIGGLTGYSGWSDSVSHRAA